MKLGILTDIHLYPTPNDGRKFVWHNPYPMARAVAQLEAGLQRCVQENVDVIVLLGDLAHIGDDASLHKALSLAAQTGKPVWVVPGNHDCTVRPEALAQAANQIGNDALKVLTASGFRPDPDIGLRVAGLSLASNTKGDSAYATERLAQHAWLSERVLLLVHHPMLSLAERCAANGLKYAGNLDNFADIAPALNTRFGPTIVMHGHLHIRDELAQGNVLQLSFAALIEPPHEIGIVEIDIDNATRTVRVHRRNINVADHTAERLPILSPNETTWLLRDGLWEKKS